MQSGSRTAVSGAVEEHDARERHRLTLPTRVVVAAAAAFFVTLAWRFLTFTGFTNDHYAHVGLAQQIMLGEWPIRDFTDPGWPLTYLLSAGAWQLFGSAMAVEWSLTALAFAVAAACSLVAAYWLSHSVLVALLVTVAEIVISPRSYGYPKLLPYAIAAVLFAALVAKPSRARVAVVGALAAAAFLLRHDHGLYLGVAGAVCVAAASRRDGVRVLTARLATLAVAALVVLLPWILFVAFNGGLSAYFDTSLEFARREANATNLRAWPWFQGWASELQSPENADAWLFWLFWSLPALCAVLLTVRSVRGREAWAGETALVASLVLVAVCANAGFLRDVLRTRFADAIVPAVLLGAWLLGLCWCSRWSRPGAQRFIQLISVAVLLATAGAIAAVAETRERIERTGVTQGLEAMTARVVTVADLLRGPHRQAASPPSYVSAMLMPFFAYVDRCTASEERILVTGEFPDVVVLAGRRFASDGVVMGAWYSSTAHQGRTVARFDRLPPLFIVNVDGQTLSRRFPEVDRYAAAHYGALATITTRGGAVPILLDRRRVPVATDLETGWPCFR